MSAVLQPAEPIAKREKRYAALPVGAIRRSQTLAQQLRRKLFDPEEIASIGASMKSDGQVQPIAVRELAEPERDGFILYELIAGEKRLAGAELFELDLIEAVVHDVTTGQALRLQLIENIQRDTIHPLVEATGYQEMMDTQGLTLQQVAEAIHKSKSWVLNRVKLLELAEEPREALMKGGMPASVALYIARIPGHSFQQQAFAKIITGGAGGACMTARDAFEFIQHNHMRELRGVVFKLNDAELLPAAGTCVDCPKRSGNQVDLFNDITNPQICTDPKCLEDKTEAFAAREREKLAEAGSEVISGKAAKRIRKEPGGKLHGFVDPDAETTLPDGQVGTYRGLLGDALPQTKLFEDPFTHRTQPLVEQKALDQALLDRGVVKNSVKSHDATTRKKAEDKARLESAVRHRLLAEVRKAGKPGAEDLLLVALHMFAGLKFDDQKRLVDSRMADQGKTRPQGHEYVGKYVKAIAGLGGGDLAVLMRDMALVGCCHVSTQSNPDAKPLFEAAKRLGIKEEKVRAAVEEENKPKPAPTKKGGKK